MLATVAPGAPSGSSATRSPSLVALASSLSTSPHGESFIDLGASVSGGPAGVTHGGSSIAGGAGGITKSPSKRVGLVLDPRAEVLCLGLMASGKFCTRGLAEDAKTCGASSHARKFQPPPSSAFLKDTEVRALCQPVFDLSIMSPAQRLHIQGVHLSADNWTIGFQQVQQRAPPKWLAFEDSPAIMVDTWVSSPSIEILSPTNAKGGILSLIPMLTSFDDSVDSEEGNSHDLDLADDVNYIQKFKARFSSLKSKRARAFIEVESGYSLVAQDLQKLHAASQSQSQTVGQPVELVGEVPESLWHGLSVVHDSVSAVASSVKAQSSSIEALADDQNHLTHSVLALESQAEDISLSVASQVAALTTDLRALEGRVLRLVPLLTHLKKGNPPQSMANPIEPNSIALAVKVTNCEQALVALRRNLEDQLTSQPQISLPNSLALECSIKELHIQMKQLQLKVVGKGVQVANKTFQAFDDVKTWVDTHLPNHWYGLFVDGVSIFEFFSAGHIDAETTYSYFYSQHRTGFKSTFEA